MSGTAYPPITPPYAPGAYTHAFAITPGTSPLPHVTRAIWVGGGPGNLEVVASGDALGSPVTFLAVPAGTLIEISASYVLASLTTSTNLVGLW